MAGFIIYDLVFLVVFILFIVFFLRRNKSKVKRQGIIFLYRADWGIKLMDYLAKKKEKTLKVLSYVSIACGYFLMISILWLIVESAYIYLRFPITQITKAPPIAPLIPYFPQLFGLSSFFPPLYFTYFLIAVAIGGIIHEFSHGVFARLVKLKVKSTGILFAGPFLGAFVEPDEKAMEKSKIKNQLAILSAGTFANVIISVITAILIIIFFSAAFAPAGVIVNTYSSVLTDIANLEIPENFSLEEKFVEVQVQNTTFLASTKVLKQTLEENRTQIILFDDAPAIRNELPLSPSAIAEFNGVKVSSFEELAGQIQKMEPGENVQLKIAVRNGFFDVDPEFKEYEFAIGEREGKPFLGVGVIPPSESTSVFGIKKIFNYIFLGAGTLDPFTYYESSLGSFGWFIYFLLWWVLFINALLALFNMLPLGPLDGGKFLQLSIVGLTKSEKAGKNVYKIATGFILLLLALMTIKWAVSFF